MELAFADKTFRDICLNEFLAVEALGSRLASPLKRRLADLAAADVVSEIFGLPGRPKELEGHNQGVIAMGLTDHYQLVFMSGHGRAPRCANGKIDWSAVRRIKILGIEKGHD